jgi:hypothetical protein
LHLGARPVKNSVWFEISVAARMNTQNIVVGVAKIDLRDAYFDPNHRKYPAGITGTGYPSEIDIIATRSGEQYNISCKFSEQENAMRLDSPLFLTH